MPPQVLPCTVGMVEAAAGGGKAGEPGGGEVDRAIDPDSTMALPPLAYTADAAGSRTWAADAWGNAEAQRGAPRTS
jgi:hypothetical protein